MKIIAILCLVAFSGSLLADPSDELASHLKLGETEKVAAKNWYKKYPEWVMASIKKNDFPKTHLKYELKGKKFKTSKFFSKFEVRDANKRQFAAYLMVRNGNDGNGLPVYKTTKESVWLNWSVWPAESLVETYSVEGNPKDADVVGFGMWLYSKKKYNEFANRILTIVALRSSDLRPMIEAYICEKEGWEIAKDESLMEWAIWDSKFYKERKILIPAADEEKRYKMREKAAEAEFKKILENRGGYKGRAPRKPAPTKMLVFIEWDIKNYKQAFATSEFFKQEKTQDKLSALLDSIKDDLELLKDNLKNITDEFKGKDSPIDQKKKVLKLAKLRLIDPMDMALLSQVANLWYKYARPAGHGNSCDRLEGVKKAIPLYEQLLKRYPYNTAYLVAMGRCYQAQENSKDARVYYEKVIEIDGAGKGNARTAAALIRNMEEKDRARAEQKKK